MKRVIQRKAKQSICDGSSLGESLKKQKRASQDIGNKTRTSAAMLGLALSMGASGSILSCHNKGAVAAEPKAPIDISSVEGLSNDLAEEGSEAFLADEQSGVVSSFPHVIREGETLWTISNRYQVSSESVIKVNGFDDEVVLRVGQKVFVPFPKQASQSEEDVVEPVAVVGSKSDGVSLQDGLESEGLQDGLEDESPIGDGLQMTIEPSAVMPDAGYQPNKVLPKQSGLGSKVEIEERSVVPTQPESALAVEKQKGVEDVSGAPAAQPLLSADDITSALASTGDDTVSEIEFVAQHVAFSEVESSATPQRFDSDVTVPATHQIQVGETLADIARQYSISTTQLAEANRIRNPNRIFAGRVLNLPEGSILAATPMVDESSDVLLSNASLEDTTVRVTEDSQTEQVVSLPPVSEVKTDGHIDIQPVNGVGVDVAPVDDHFYVDRLLNEIQELSENYRFVEPAPAVEVSEVSVEVEPSASTDEIAYVPGIASAPQRVTAVLDDVQDLSGESVGPGSMERSTESEATVQESPDLVAAAPLGSENYVPLNQPVTGRMVSPDLPPLTGPDNYLPDGSSSFNGYRYPAQGTLTSGYGWRWGRMHRGIDVAAPIGTPIVAAAPGVIEYSGWNSGGYGNMVEVRHPDGSMTRYAHNSRNLVRVGQNVAQGEQIAEMGSTGYSTGPHVHFEIHLPDQGTVNPVAYLSQ